MKNLKILFGVLVVFLAMVVTYSCGKENQEKAKQELIKEQFIQLASVQVKSMGLKKVTDPIEVKLDDECKDPNIVNCLGPYQQTYVIDYQGCPITVVAKIYICPDLETGGTYFVTGENFTFNYPWLLDPECDSLFGQILSLWWQQDFDGLNNFLDALNYDLETAWEAAFVNQFITNSPSKSYFCDLPQLDANIIVDNYKGSCFRRCFNYSSKEGLTWQDIRCGYGCCKRTSIYCIDRATGQLESTTSVEIVKECQYNPGPYPGCVYLSQCTESCSKVN
ncbi:MAG: hypothetical protein J5I52_12555 [Saprospiraceae bacterium]|nr:MAG: hypothetical protein UZ09_BCD002000470 [Bacteroidetes bacterium OLB9]MCO6464968.1 hypothetical protein [Saprospiraceae bacterium]